jgi:hypothetical protein
MNKGKNTREKKPEEAKTFLFCQVVFAAGSKSKTVSSAKTVRPDTQVSMARRRPNNEIQNRRNQSFDLVFWFLMQPGKQSGRRPRESAFLKTQVAAINRNP